MRTSDAVRILPDFRYYHKAKTLITALENRYRWYTKHVPDRVTAFHKLRLDETVRLLQSEIDESDQGRPILWEINPYLSRQPLLKLPTAEIHDWVFYGLPPPKRANLTELEHYIAEQMNFNYHQAQAKAHYFAIMCEIAYRAYHGWYMIFNTLTLKPSIYNAIVNGTSIHHKQYIRQIDRETATASYGSVRKASGHTFHTYFTCTEQGAQNGRLHLHAIHCLRAIPRNITDPNYGKITPDERNLLHWKRFWPHGRSEPRMVRYSPNDAWGTRGWRWPTDKGEPLEVKSPLAVANYISKYIEKGYDTCLRNKLKYRVKKSHKLGHALLNEMLEPLSTSTLITIASLDSLSLKLNNTTIPLSLLRPMCLRVLSHRSSSDTSQCLDLLALAKLTITRLSPLHSARASTQTILENSHSSMQYLSMIGTTNADISNALNELRTQRKIIDDKYFPRTKGFNGTANSSNTTTYRPKHN